jgi:zinc and cadmium transporter
MEYIILYTFISILLVSLIAIFAVVFFSFNIEKVKKYLIYAVSFSAGSLLGGAFFHLLPESIEKYGYFDLKISFFILFGFLSMFLLEKIVQWRHCHNPDHIDKCVHTFAYMNLVGDFVHNFIDGLVIGASYMIDIRLGFATTIAVIFHELPQEIGDFGVLLHGGFTRKKAILLNFLSAISAFLGAGLAIFLGMKSANILFFLLPFAIGNFIYIAASDLVPELHKEKEIKKNIFNFIFILLGLAFMYSILLLPIGHSHSHVAEVDHDHEHIIGEHIYLDGDHISWEEAKNLVANCEIKGVFQNHQKEVTLELKNGNRLYTISEEIDNIFHIIKDNETRCGKLVYMGTE